MPKAVGCGSFRPGDRAGRSSARMRDVSFRGPRRRPTRASRRGVVRRIGRPRISFFTHTRSRLRSIPLNVSGSPRRKCGAAFGSHYYVETCIESIFMGFGSERSGALRRRESDNHRSRPPGRAAGRSSACLPETGGTGDPGDPGPEVTPRRGAARRMKEHATFETGGVALGRRVGSRRR